MSTATDEYLDRYTRTEQARDGRGRTFTVRRLRLSQQSRLFEWTDAPTTRNMFLVAASVSSMVNVEGLPVAFKFPTSREEVEATLDVLDQEGFAAAQDAIMRLNGVKVPEPDGTAA